MQDIKTRYEHAGRFLPGQVERLVLNGEPVIRRSPAGVLYFAREYRLPDGAVAREFVSLARDGSTAPLFDAAKLCSLLGQCPPLLRLRILRYQPEVPPSGCGLRLALRG